MGFDEVWCYMGFDDGGGSGSASSSDMRELALSKIKQEKSRCPQVRRDGGAGGLSWPGGDAIGSAVIRWVITK